MGATETFDDVMASPITVNGPATVYFLVAPYFQGETGSYALDLEVTRGNVTDIVETNLPDRLSLYPFQLSKRSS